MEMFTGVEGMQIMDGLEASRQIQAKYPPHLRPRIVALSADTLQVSPHQIVQGVALWWWEKVSHHMKNTDKIYERRLVCMCSTWFLRQAIVCV